MQAIHNFLRCFFNKANYLQPIILLIMRLWIARVFFLAGLVKIADFDTTGPLADETQHPEQLRISKYLVWRFVS